MSSTVTFAAADRVPSAAPGLVLHRATGTDQLAGALAELLATDPPGPFDREIVAVPTPGVERWLAQSLSVRLGAGPAGDGVCAGVSFPTLGRLLADLVAGASTPGEDDPWRPDRLVWTLLGLFDEVAGEAWFAPVSRHLRGADAVGVAAESGAEAASLAGGLRPGRRYLTARRLARLFDSYAAQRPGLIEDWRTGGSGDGLGVPLPPELAWQPMLWRAAAERIAARHPGWADPVQRVTDAVGWLNDDPQRAALPARVSVFGPTRLTRQQARVLAALGQHRAVHLWLCHPSPVLWRRVDAALAAHRDRTTHPVGDAAPVEDLVTRAEDPTRHTAVNRLTARLGRDLREFQAVLHPWLGAQNELAPPRRPETLLGRLQTALTEDRNAPEDREAPDATTSPPVLDDSVQIHASHGPERQVEVLRDVITGLLAEDPTLEPRDIVVMCPDVERYAALITAAFGFPAEDADLSHPGQGLRVRLADRSLGQVNPLLALLRRLLALPLSRNGSGELIDLCATEAVARRFRFSADDQTRIAELVRRAGVRWGIDSADRARFGMAAFAQNTWLSGIDRLLTGVALSEDDLPILGTALPLDEVDSGDIALVGRLTELVLRVRALVTRLTQRQPLTEWQAALRQALEDLTATPPTEAWQLNHAHAVLARLGGGEPEALSPGDLRARLDDLLEPRPSRSNFRTGALTVCTLSPMRSVPHRVVCLLGLDDGVFPRAAADDGDNVLHRTPVVGDYDRRSEDRQLLLDAVQAARERLIVVYAARDSRTNEPRPPAVPLQELLDALDALDAPRDPGTVDRSRWRDRITRAHPLQPHAPGNFTGPGPVSFDRLAFAAAQVAAAPRPAAAAERRMTWAPVALPDTVDLEDLGRFFRHPARAFLRSRLGLYFPDDEDDPMAEAIPVELDGLGFWALGNRMLSLAVAGQDLDRICAAEWLRGQLPPRALGAAQLDRLRGEVIGVLRSAQPLLEVPVSSVDIALELTLPDEPLVESRPDPLPGPDSRPDSVRLTGVVGGIHGSDLVTVGFSRPSAVHELVAWTQLLAVTATRPEQPWRAQVVGRGRPITLGPVPSDVARAELGRLIALSQRGRQQPVLLPPKTALAYVRRPAAVRDPRDPDTRRSLITPWQREHDSSWARFVGAEVEALLDTDFPTLAERVFEPLLAAEGT